MSGRNSPARDLARLSHSIHSMANILSLRELIDNGAIIAPHEAVAIVQQLLQALADGSASTQSPSATESGDSPESTEPPGSVSQDDVLISSTGKVQWHPCAEAPSVAAIGALLETMLPGGTGVRVPGALRLAIARACAFFVDAPSFGSLKELSAALERFERGDRREVVRQLIVRSADPLDLEGSAAHPTPVPAERIVPDSARPVSGHAVEPVRPVTTPVAPATPDYVAATERRRTPVSAFELRRQLREADALLFEQRARAAAPKAAPISREEVAADLALSRPSPTHDARPHTFQRQTVAAPSAGQAVAPRTRRVAGYAMAVLLCFVAGYAGVMLRERRTPAPAADGAVAATEVAVQPPAPADASDSGGSERPPVAGAEPKPATPQQARQSGSINDTDDAEPLLRRAVSEARGPQFSPAFAADGSTLFFHTGRSTDAHSALMLTPAGSARVAPRALVNDGAKNYHVQPSPDGRHIAFDSDRDGDRGVYLADIDGRNVHRVAGAEHAGVPTWAPDSDRLTFVRPEPGRPNVWNLWMVSLDSGDTRRLTDYRVGQTWGASWFADGTRICYSHEDKLVVLDVQTGATRAYSTPVKGHIVRTPAVSPQGDRVVFQVYRNGVWLLDLQTGSMRRMLEDGTAEEFAWAPDGQRVAFHSRRDGEWGIWTMRTAQFER